MACLNDKINFVLVKINQMNNVIKANIVLYHTIAGAESPISFPNIAVNPSNTTIICSSNKWADFLKKEELIYFTNIQSIYS